MPYQIPNLGMFKLIYAHLCYRKQGTPRFLRNPSNYLTTTKTMDIHQTSKPSYKLVCKNATVLKVEQIFERTEGPSSVPKSKQQHPKNFLNICRIQRPTLE